ncbi:MAG TPA: SAV_915 family protein [Streptosporangiaceae bacterium]
MSSQGESGVPEPWEGASPWLSDDQAAAPAVIGSHPSSLSENPAGAAQARADVRPPDPVAPIAYIPSARFRPGDASVRFEVRPLDDGRSALLVYSSLELLVAGCGQAQPWVAVRPADPDGLEGLARRCGADVALWDVNLPADGRHAGSPSKEV